MEKITKNLINNLTGKKGGLIQVSSRSLKKILKIKDNYSNLLSKKIEDIYNTINNTVKPKLYINMTTKDPLYKQTIIFISVISQTP